MNHKPTGSDAFSNDFLTYDNYNTCRPMAMYDVCVMFIRENLGVITNSDASDK